MPHRFACCNLHGNHRVACIRFQLLSRVSARLQFVPQPENRLRGLALDLLQRQAVPIDGAAAFGQLIVPFRGGLTRLRHGRCRAIRFAAGMRLKSEARFPEIRQYSRLWSSHFPDTRWNAGHSFLLDSFTRFG